MLFLLYQQEERKRKPGTLAGYCQALTRGLKYLAAAQGVDTNEAQAYIRALNSRFQREAAATQKTWQELSSANKWLHWEEVLKVVVHPYRTCSNHSTEQETRPVVELNISSEWFNCAQTLAQLNHSELMLSSTTGLVSCSVLWFKQVQ